MFHSFRTAIAGLLALSTLAQAQAPVVPLTDPVVTARPTQLPVAMPVVPEAKATDPAGTPAVPAKPTIVSPEAPVATPSEPEKQSEEPAKEPDRYLIEGLLANTAAGKRLQDKGYRIYGWTEGVYTPSTARSTNFPLGQNDLANRFQLSQNYLRLEKTIDPKLNERQFGFQVDTIAPGTDARYTMPRGLFNGQFSDGRLYGFDVPQAFAKAYLPEFLGGATLQVGRYFAPIGVESIDATITPFTSRSYSFLYNPYTLTGAQLAWNIGENWSITQGLSAGVDQFINPASRLTYNGSLRWEPKGGKSSVTLNLFITNPRFDQVNNQNNYNIYNLVLTHSFTKRLKYMFDAYFSHEDNIPGIGSDSWYSFANYLMFDVTDKLSWNHRVEFFEDINGHRIGVPGLISSFTSGVNWRPTSWLSFRPELRYDIHSGGARGAFENGDRHLFTVGLGAIVRW